MADSFDPYRKWLAIPLDEQPPHYYRLLAIPLFESDQDVISNAADGRMSQVKSYQTGPHGRLSQPILNQIAAAKICLLDPKKKAAYDCQLQERLALSSGNELADGAAEQDAGAFDLSTVTAVALRRTPARTSKTKNQLWPIYAAVGGGIIAVGAAVLFFILHANSPAEDARVALNQPPGTNSISISKPEPKPQPRPLLQAKTQAGSPIVVQKPPSLAARQAGADGVTSQTGSSKPPAIANKPKLELAGDVGDENKLKPQPAGRVQLIADKIPARPEPKQVAMADPATESNVAKSSRLALPEKSLQQAAEAKVREVFQQEFAAAKTSDARAALAKKLQEQADGSKDDAAAYYVLLRMAGEQAVLAADPAQAIDIVDKMQQRFQIDAAGMKAGVLAAIMRQSGMENATASVVFEAAMKLCDDAVAHDDFELAGRFAKAAAAAARKSRDPEQNLLALAREKEIELLKTRFAAVQEALDAIGSDPSDGGASIVVGQWYCFTKKDWDKGLPMLAKGNRDDLAKLARQDLAAPNDAKQQIALADAWWNLGEAESPANKSAIQGRARHWYEQAVDKTSGLDKARIQKRLKEQTAVATALPIKPAGREVAVDVTNLPFVGKTVVGGKPQDIVIDSLSLPKDFKLPQPFIPGATVKHFFFLHATSQFEINLESRLKSGQIPKRFKAFLYLVPTSREKGSDGMVWTVEAGNKSHLKLLLTTPQAQDMNPVDLVLPPGTTRIVIRSLPGEANNDTHDWGVMANPVVVFRR